MRAAKFLCWPCSPVSFVLFITVLNCNGNKFSGYSSDLSAMNKRN